MSQFFIIASACLFGFCTSMSMNSSTVAISKQKENLSTIDKQPESTAVYIQQLENKLAHNKNTLVTLLTRVRSTTEQVDQLEQGASKQKELLKKQKQEYEKKLAYHAEHSTALTSQLKEQQALTATCRAQLQEQEHTANNYKKELMKIKTEKHEARNAQLDEQLRQAQQELTRLSSKFYYQTKILCCLSAGLLIGLVNYIYEKRIVKNTPLKTKDSLQENQR